jgi:hypothetical protein
MQIQSGQTVPLIVDAQGAEKNAGILNWTMINAANSDWIAYGHRVHRCDNILAEEYLYFILLYIPLSRYLYSLIYLRLPPSLYVPPYL